MDRKKRYNKALSTKLKAPGTGCHASLQSVANSGVSAGVTPEQLFKDIRANIPRGGREVPDYEIWDAINKKLSERNGNAFIPKPNAKPIVSNGKAALQKIISQGLCCDEADLRRLSPIPLHGGRERDTALFLETLYGPHDLLWIGDRLHPGVIGKTIRPAGEWIPYFKEGGRTAPHIIPNPLNGVPCKKKSGVGTTLRGDGNVEAPKYAIAEFDNLGPEAQIRFWSAVKLPIVALVDSGGKSIHGILEVAKLANVTTPEEWQIHIKSHLYDRLLIPMGIDAACSNLSRLSRLPGHFRTETGQYQRLLWLSPEGRSIA